MGTEMMEMSAAALDFKLIEHFGRHEFPGDVLEHVEDDLILGLSEYRDRLGHAVIPSPVVAGWYRKGGSKTSRHYAVGRLSDAADVFPQCSIREAWLTAMGCDWWGGIGVYLDTNGPSGHPQPMLHLDLRPGRVIWMRHKGKYIYPLRSPEEMQAFFELLSEVA